MRKIGIIIFIAFWSTQVLLSQQCLEDRHSTNITDAWVSCQMSSNPYVAVGNAHWILYNFNGVENLYSSTIWNINHPDYLDYGAKSIRIDYSEDKVNWINWGTINLAQAQGRSDYLGEAGPDFNGIAARHLLITVIETYGDLNCTGFSEIKINTQGSDSNCPDQLVFDADDDMFGLEDHQAIGITATNTIYNNAEVLLKAEECIQFMEGFTLEVGAEMHALIRSCGDVAVDNNMIVNGDFEAGSFDPWEIENHETADALISIDTNNPYAGNASARVDVLSTTAVTWHLQFEQFGMSVNIGETYILEFAARSNVNRTIPIAASRHNSPWNVYNSQQINVTPVWQTYSMSFIPDEVNIDFLRISASLSNNDPAVYWFDNFVLKAQ